MKLRVLGILALAFTVVGCPDNKPVQQHRAELKRLTGNTVEFVPTAGQMPYCLLYTISDKGVVRQLTMTRENRSTKCEPGQPIGGVPYKIPLDEGSVRAHIFFSDRKLEAASVGQQIYELSTTNPRFSALDLRLPGEVKWETLEFTPTADPAAETGAVVGAGGKPGDAPAAATDAGGGGEPSTGPADGG